MTLIYTVEESLNVPAKVKFSNKKNKRQSPANEVVSKINFKTIENKAEKFLYLKLKRGHINLRLTYFLFYYVYQNY